jgi:hypothetical protein
MLYEPQPGLFKQVFGSVGPVRQPGEKVVEPAVKGVVHRIEPRGSPLRRRPTSWSSIAIHQSKNAEGAET